MRKGEEMKTVNEYELHEKEITKKLGLEIIHNPECKGLIMEITTHKDTKRHYICMNGCGYGFFLPFPSHEEQLKTLRENLDEVFKQ
jgi:hypothetical protein